jgi:bacteriorhodopsin
VHEVTAPWRTPLTGTEHDLIAFGIAVAGFALLAMLVRTWVTRGEVSGRYRPAIAASLGLTTVAALSYVLIYFQFDGAYSWNGSVWVPGIRAASAWSTRYLDWAVSVPLLVVELIAVSNLQGAAMKRTRSIAVVAAFLMIATGYLGGVAIGGGEDRTALLVWGVVSSAFFVVVYVLVLRTVLASLPALPSAARPPYRAAMLVLMITWFVYPVVYGLQGMTSGGGWAVTGQLLLCTADVVAKVGFGVLLHRVAKLRTAFDVQTGIDTHPETIWIDRMRQSDALLPASSDREALRAEVEAAELRRAEERSGG